MLPDSAKACASSTTSTLQVVGEWWSILILRDCLRGITRFDQFRKNLQISPNLLTRRLQTLADAGLIERRLYCNRPSRYEYMLTERGKDFQIVINAMVDWGSRHFPVAVARTAESATKNDHR